MKIHLEKVYCGTMKGEIRVLHRQTGETLKIVEAHRGSVVGLDIYDDRIYSAGFDGVLIGWDLEVIISDVLTEGGKETLYCFLFANSFNENHRHFHFRWSGLQRNCGMQPRNQFSFGSNERMERLFENLKKTSLDLSSELKWMRITSTPFQRKLLMMSCTKFFVDGTSR